MKVINLVGEGRIQVIKHVEKPGEGDQPPTVERLVVGELGYASRPGNTVEMHLDVHENWRRHGIGRTMLCELQEITSARKAMTIYSFSAADNDNAYGFFTGCGFSAQLAPNFYGEGRHAWFYVKPLRAPE